MTLKAERCEACKSDSPLVTDAEERQLKPQVADWEIVTVNNVRRLKKTFEFDGWMPAVAFANDVARIADQWGKATVTWWTHAIKGLHRNDFIMAAKTDELITGK
jgi:4a-hydroxytetrahydrobiopterin dehydratase